MPKIWTAEDYAEAFTRGPHHDTLAWSNRRFATQGEWLVETFGLTPAEDELVFVGNGFGGLAKWFQDRGHPVTLVEAAQYILDEWDKINPVTKVANGAPGITPFEPPTDSHDPDARQAVIASAKRARSGQTRVWCIAHVLESYGDHELDLIRDFGDYTTPETGGKVVHFVTPDSPGAIRTMGLNWHTAEDWWRLRDEHFPGQVVVDVHDWRTAPSEAAAKARKPKVKAAEAPRAAYNAAFPFDTPETRVANGPHEIAGGIYIVAGQANGPLMTTWAEGEGSYVAVGDSTPNVGGAPVGLACCPRPGRGELVVAVATAGGVYSCVYNASTDKWDPPVLVESEGRDPWSSRPFAFIAEDGAEALWLVCGTQSKRIMGTFYDDLALHRSVDNGASWQLQTNLQAGAQRAMVHGTIVVGNDGIRLHIGLHDLTGNGFYVYTYVSGTVNESNLIDWRSEKPAWPIRRDNQIHFLYDPIVGSALNAVFDSVDNPFTINVFRVITEIAGGPFAACQLNGTIYYAQTTGASGPLHVAELPAAPPWRELTFAASGASALYTMGARLTTAGLVYLDDSRGPATWYHEWSLTEPVGFTVMVQHTLLNPQDFQLVDAGAWNTVPMRPEPKPGEIGAQDDVPGHIMIGNVQGVCETADHYHFGTLWDETAEVWCSVFTMWNDDPDDWAPEEMWAQVWTFHPLTPDPALGGQYNTIQKVTVYCVPGSYEWNRERPPTDEIRDLAEFAPPTHDVRHGIWVTNESLEAHAAARTDYDWQSWMSDLPQADQERARQLPYWNNPPMW